MSAETGTDSNYGLMDTRYAIYFAPRPESPLKRFADAWLGRDPDRDERVSQPVIEGFAPERLHEITAFPRHYGFHATLKAPFRPVPDLAADALLGDLEFLRSGAAAAAAAAAGRRTRRFPGAGPGRAQSRDRPARRRLRA